MSVLPQPVSSSVSIGSAFTASTAPGRRRPGPVMVELNQPVQQRRASQFAGQRVHFVGIGGSGMNGLARILLDCGASVTGSDKSPNRQTIELIGRGIKISRTQHGELLDKGVHLVVRTAAVPDTHVEIRAAAALGIRTIKYAELLGEVMRERLGVAVAGTHGKSTTTAMTALALLKSGCEPSFVVGGTVPQLGGTGSRSGSGDAFVAEACEYDRSFHNLAPQVAVITNIEEDHLDCYKDIHQIIESFRHFCALVPSDGTVIVNGGDANVSQAIMNLNVPVQTVSLGEATTWSTFPRGLIDGCYQGQVCFNGKPVAVLRLKVPGLHNLMNATMALAAARACGADLVSAAAAISGFTGVDRRMTPMGYVNADANNATIVDDYGHHPTEVRTTLKALREKYAPRRLICIFQPHQHSRTRHLLDDFAHSFDSADEVVMPDIYFVRDSEEERHAVCTDDLVKKIVARGHAARHISSFSDIVKYVRQVSSKGDLVVTMGAGNVNDIGIELAEAGR
jgi:UDP-N-acetylmuramate--alanine ligase